MAGDAPQGEWLGSSRNSALRDENDGEFRVKCGAGIADGSSCGQQGLGPESGLSDRLSPCEPW